jgi:hypothetical protein
MSLPGIYKIRASYKPTADFDEFVGETGTLYYSSELNRIVISDGIDPNGKLLNMLRVQDFSENDFTNSRFTSTLAFDTDSFDLEVEENGTITVKTKAGLGGGINNIKILGSFEDENELPVENNEIGDAYLINGDIWIWEGNEWKNGGPVKGPQGDVGYTGSQGEIGFTGSVGFTGSQGDVGFVGSQGFTGSQGDTGFTGSQGDQGFTGSSGAGSTNLIFTEDSTTARLTSYRSDAGEIFTIRTAELANGTFILNLAGFTPTLSATVLPSTTLNWDVAATAFRVTVANPSDFTDRYISSVLSIAQTAGSVSTDLANFTTTGPNLTPAGGVNWQQTFTVDNMLSFIRPTSSTIVGGSAAAIVVFNETSTATEQETEFTSDLATWQVNWQTPTLSAGISNLTGNTFLQTYTATNYSVTVTGMSNSQNFQHTVTGNNGTVSNVSGNGSLTFTNPIHKNNTDIARSVSVATVFTRPQFVTGTSYTATLAANSSNVVASFTYPSFWVFTLSVAEPPTREIVVNGSNYRSGVTVLANSVRTFSASVNNDQTFPRVFWFGVRSVAAQPTSFRTGASAALLSDVVPVTATVQLAPDVVPPGYLNEQFSLYGIILQPGSTFISIG